MPPLSANELWRPARDLPFLALCVAFALSMLRSVDQPSISIDVGGTDVSLVPADIALALLGALAVQRLLGRGSLPEPARAITAAAAAFSAWLLVSSLLNGVDALVGAGKLLEYGLLALGSVLFVQRRAQLTLLLIAVVAVTALAAAYALLGFVRAPGERQGAFLGSHDLAALGTMALSIGLAALYAPRGRVPWLPLVAGIAGAVAVTLAAALAGLLGLYLAIVAIVGLAAARRVVTRRALAITVATAAAVTVGAVALRSSAGDLGFVKENTAEVPGAENAASWSHRLVYAYIGGRVFLDNPILGTGWHGELPPEEFARYLPDARRRFPEQPETYFPRPDGNYTPQQTYDQILYELGIVGALLFLALAVIAARTALQVGRRWPRNGADEAVAYVPAAWVASLGGALAGAALFGGIPLTAIFWVTLGIVAVAPSLMPPPPVPPSPRERRPLAVALR